MIKSMKRYWKYLLPALPLMFTLTACEEDYTPHQLPESIVMEAIELSYTVEQQNKLYVDNTETMAYPMLSGESVCFDYTTTPDPSEVTFPTVCWTTNNPDVVSIAEDGTITAIGAGNAIVTIAPDTPNLVAQASLKIIVSDGLVSRRPLHGLIGRRRRLDGRRELHRFAHVAGRRVAIDRIDHLGIVRDRNGRSGSSRKQSPS